MRAAFFLLILIGLTGCKRDVGPQPPSVAELTEMLKKDDPDTQVRAASWVINLGPAAAQTKPALLAALKSPHMAVRQNAAIALGKIGPAAAAEAVPALTSLLSDPDANVQNAAISSLGEFGPAAASAVPAIEALGKESSGCKGPSETALKKIRS